MTDPITLAIATAIAGKTAESLTEQARQSLAALTRRVREKFRGRPAELATLEAARDDPDSGEHITELARALHEASADDPEFGNEIRTLWDQVHVAAAAQDDGVVNVFSGRAEKVVQLRDVHGDLNIR